MKKYFKPLNLAAAAFALSLAFTACNSSEIKGDEESALEGSETYTQEVNPDDPALTPDTTTGATGGMNQMDPEGTGNNMDKRADSINSGNK